MGSSSGMSLRAKACCNVPRVAFFPLRCGWRAMPRLRHRARRRGPHRAKKRGVASDGNEAVRRRAKSFVSRVCLSASIRDRSKMSSISASSAFQRRVRLETTDRLCRGWRSSATVRRADRRQVDASTTRSSANGTVLYWRSPSDFIVDKHIPAANILVQHTSLPNIKLNHNFGEESFRSSYLTSSNCC